MHRNTGRSTTDSSRALADLFQRESFPTKRVLITLAGFALFAYGFRLRAPWACLVGSVGLGIAAEGIVNANLKERVSEAVDMVEEKFGAHGSRGASAADRLPADLRAR